MEIKLTWDKNTEEDLMGYRVYYWLVGGFSIPRTNYLETTESSITVSNLTKGKRYCFYVTAFNTSNLESPPSNYVTNEVAMPDRAMVNQGGWTASLYDGGNNLLANDSLIPGRDYRDKVVLITNPQHGKLDWKKDGTFLYQHFGGPNLQDSFEYGIRDGLATNTSAVVTISVFSLNQFERTSQQDILISFNSDIASSYQLEWNFVSPWAENAWTNFRSMKRTSSGGAGFVPFFLREHATNDQVFYRLNYESLATNYTIGPFGYLRRILPPGLHYIGLPFYPSPVFRGKFNEVAADGVFFHENPLKRDQFNLVNGSYQFILKKSSPGPSTSSNSEWWPIHYNTANAIYVITRGENLHSLLTTNDPIEVCPLMSLEDVFKSSADENCLENLNNSPLLDEHGADIIRLLTGQVPGLNYPYYGEEIIFKQCNTYFKRHSISGEYMTITPSELKLFPGQAFSLERRGTPITLYLFGMIETGSFTHYLSPGTNWISSIYPVSIPLTKSGLQESGWELDDKFLTNFIFQPVQGYLLERENSDPKTWVQIPPVPE